MAVSVPPCARPSRLVDLLINYCTSNPQSFCQIQYKEKHDAPICIRPGVFIPSNLADAMIEKFCQKNSDSVSIDEYTALWTVEQSALRQVNLSRSTIHDGSIGDISNHKLCELNLSECSNLTESCLPDLLRITSLRVLDLSNCKPVLERYISSEPDFPLDKLRVLKVGYTGLNSTQLYWFTKMLKNLVALDVSGLVKNGDLMFLKPVCNQLRSLVLHDCLLLESSLKYICTLVQLRHVDISAADSSQQQTILTDGLLRNLVQSLPHLTSLDLSGNEYNLTENENGGDVDDDTVSLGGNDNNNMVNGGAVCVDAGGDSHRLRSSLLGLEGLAKPLDYLGLVDMTGIGESDVEHLPAVKVAAKFTEEQILNIIEVYLKRSSYLVVGLNYYFDLLRAIDCRYPVRGVELILTSMNYYSKDNLVQVSGSASLYHLTRGSYSCSLTAHHKQAIIACLLDAMETITSSTLQQNCGLTLYNFHIPDDFLCQFERVVRNIVKLAQSDDSQGVLQRIYVHLCNSIVCQVEGERKLLVGQMGIIQCMLKLIGQHLEKNQCDEVLETAWSALWNVTDETSGNCEMFLDGNGMELFMKCREAFPDKPELLRNMMGLIGNVAEVPHLRPQLLQYASMFMELLSDRSDGIEVSYNAAGTLSHITADGPEAWTVTSPLRCDVLEKMKEAILSWGLDTQRNINYRSFGPLLRLLEVTHTPEVQLWAVWALANLCTVTPVKYCKLLEQENGISLLQKLEQDERTLDIVKGLVSTTLNLVLNRHEQRHDVHDV